ncbi:HNH endonuclease [bacterium]|nr:HNH endonuclease [bacterium]
MPEKPRSITRSWLSTEKVPEISRITLRERDQFYHTARWKRESRSFRERFPLCAGCHNEGIVEAAIITDHIIPKDICPDPWDQKNWQGLCKKCHAKKSAKDKKHFKK